MTIVGIINSVTSWVQENICKKIELKQPPDDKPILPTNPAQRPPITHEVNFVHPEAYALYVPGKDNRIPINTPPSCPCICVQVLDGEDDVVKRRRYLTVRLSLSVWNPGYQSEEIFYPHPDMSRLIPRYWTKGNPEHQEYLRHLDGWQDVWNLADLTLRAIEGADAIAGLAIAQDESIKYGSYAENGNVDSYYPYWHSWITFKLECGLVTAVSKTQQEFL